MRLAPRSVRLRLTLWYVATLGTILVGYAAVVYALMRGNLSAQLDQQLHRDYEVAAHALYRTANGDIAWRPQQHFHDGNPLRADTLVELWRTDGSLLWRHADGAVRELKLATPRSESRGYASFFENGLHLRALLGRVTIDRETFVIRLVRSEETLRSDLGTLIAWMALGLPLALAPAALGGYLVARRALDPVARMTAAARAITAEDLSTRLPVVNPDDELGQLAETFNAAFDRLEQSFAQLRAFTADATHELRTPLAAIRSVGEVALQRRRAEGDYREAIGSMLEEAERLNALVNGLLLLARADQGRLQLETGEVELDEAAGNVVTLLRYLAEEKRQTIVLTNRSTARVRADATLLCQALLDILDNAITYSPPGATIAVTTGGRNGVGIVEIRDNGPGIAPHEQRRVFDRFYRGDPSRTRGAAGGGYGLGLAIAKSLIEVQGGRIELDSELARGATFRIVLPTI